MDPNLGDRRDSRKPRKRHGALSRLWKRRGDQCQAQNAQQHGANALKRPISQDGSKAVTGQNNNDADAVNNCSAQQNFLAAKHITQGTCNE
jgi:hypothetical protein